MGNCSEFCAGRNKDDLAPEMIDLQGKTIQSRPQKNNQAVMEQMSDITSQKIIIGDDDKSQNVRKRKSRRENGKSSKSGRSKSKRKNKEMEENIDLLKQIVSGADLDGNKQSPEQVKEQLMGAVVQMLIDDQTKKEKSGRKADEDNNQEKTLLDTDINLDDLASDYGKGYQGSSKENEVLRQLSTQNIKIRWLKKNDFKKGFNELAQTVQINTLSTQQSDEIETEKFSNEILFNPVKNEVQFQKEFGRLFPEQRDRFKIIVAEINDKCVGIASILIEQQADGNKVCTFKNLLVNNQDQNISKDEIQKRLIFCLEAISFVNDCPELRINVYLANKKILEDLEFKRMKDSKDVFNKFSLFE